MHFPGKFVIAVPSAFSQISSTKMPFKFARACCVAVSLGLAVAGAADPTPALIGATREQVLARFGEPKSQIQAGNRVILFYARERIVLRDDVVIDVEQVAPDSTRRPATETPNAIPPRADAPAVPGVPPAATDAAASPGQPAAPVPVSSGTAEPKLEIKSVRPPSVRPGGAPDAPVAPTSPTTTAPTATAPTPTPTKEDILTKEKERAAEAKREAAAAKAAAAKAAEAAAKAAADKAAADKKAKLELARRRLDNADTSDPTEEIIGPRTLLLVGAAVFAGFGYWIWRRKQRQLELDATSVAQTPENPPPPPPPAVSSSSPASAPVPLPSSGAAAKIPAGTSFTESLLSSLDGRRFEDLVAAYYNKTGVVATRTHAGAMSPVQIKISWKGEPQPFACVQCFANPRGLIEAKPLHDLVAALAKENIRRGYVVTSGKFSVPARDFAAEKQLTLMPGDILLEKLNALPASARAEIMQSISAAG